MSHKSGLWNNLVETLASLRLSVFIFLILAACSVVGTLIPQGLTEAEIHRQYGHSWIIETFGLTNLYYTKWFQFLLLLLCINLVICTLQRLPKTIKLLRQREDQVQNPQKLMKFSHNLQLTTRAPLESVRGKLEGIISQEFSPITATETPEGFSATAVKGRFSPLLVYVVHLSILVILAGALIGSIFGFKGFMNVNEGQTSAEVMLSEGHASHSLPFQVRCDDFDVSYYDTGAPKEFRSDLVVIEEGKEVLKKTIRVNDPLTYRGITFYQSSYGVTLKDAEIEFEDRKAGKTYKLTLPFRQTMEIPGTGDKVEIVEYQQNLSQFGPALGLVLSRQGQESSGSWVLVDMPQFHGNRILNYQIKVLRTDQSSYTGLQVKEDPGVWIVWIGFTVMLIGIGFTFYLSHRRLWVWAGPVSEKGGSTRIVLAGRTNKNPLAFEEEFNRVCDRLKEEFPSEIKETKKRK